MRNMWGERERDRFKIGEAFIITEDCKKVFFKFSSREEGKMGGYFFFVFFCQKPPKLKLNLIASMYSALSLG